MSIFTKLQQKIRDRFIASNSLEDAELYTNFNFSKYIRPSVLREDGIWITNDGEFAWICELAPRIRMGSATAETFEPILSKIPIGFYSQIILFGGKNIEGYISEHKKTHSSDNPLIQKTLDNYLEFLRTKTNESIGKEFKTQLKNNRVIFVLKNKNIDKLNEVREDISNALDVNNFFPKTLSEHELKYLFYEMLNPNHNLKNIPEYNERKYFNQQIMTTDNKIYCYKDSIVVDKKYFKALTPIQLPKYAHISQFGLKLGDYLSDAMNSNQFIDTYMITLNLTRTPTSEIGSIKRAKSILKKAGNSSKAKKEKTESDNIVDGINDRTPMFKMDLNIIIGGESYKEVKANCERIKSFWQKKDKSGEEDVGNIILEDFKYQMIPLFIGSLPAGINNEYFKLITKSANENHFVNEVCQFLPLEVDLKGNASHLLFASRRAQMCGIDFFKSDAAKNGFIIAGSGGGKSFLANYIAFMEYIRGTKLFIIDVGNSYKKLCELVGGQYISVDTKNPISFNPFSGVQTAYNRHKQEQTKDTADDLTNAKDYMVTFLYEIGANLSKTKALEDKRYTQGFLSDVVLELLKNNETTNHILEIHDVAEYISANYTDKRLVDFAIHLKPWCKNGSYYPFVSGESNVDLSNQMVVLDLTNVKDKPELRDALIYSMVSNISSYIYKDNHSGQRFKVMIDEMHNYLGEGKSEIMQDFFDKAYRQFRKHNASILGITQGFADIWDSKKGGLSHAGQAIMTNSPWQIFLKQNEMAVNALIESKVFSFTDIDIKLLKNTTTKKGHYSEIFVIDPNEQKSVLRLINDRFFYYVLTSDPEDNAKISEIMTTYNLNTSDAIQFIVDNEKR